MKDNIYVLLLISMGGLFMLVVSFVLIFIRNQNNLLKKQHQLQQAELAHQQELLKTIIVSQEAERKRIGQDLHDDVGTALSNLRITIEMFNNVTTTGSGEFSSTCKYQIDKIVQDVRHISHNLSPPGLELYGFMGSLEDLTEFITATGKLQVNITDNANPVTDQLGAEVSLSLYRVFEELLNNTLKHANASLVNIKFDIADDYLLISYHDNGRGIAVADKTKKGMGRQNIESRLGIIGAAYEDDFPGRTGFNINIRLKTDNI
ncbi:histidine kinase [Mucilaginibacter sp. KACC 22773]|uniref:sensor histidine kinase n=1 Tax=Mucilaginibacter sp. KACC 22773 TaxID=3025671 RepID=UPI00236641CD|nr:histidine kinase [Mucilaginibacter sp. KACC 22773]WDF77420.1 histidine kinase [Mucilaginibacter sp. KACC 22773]